MKKILSLMVAAMLGLSSASAQVLLTEPEESFVEQNRESSIENQGEIQDVSFPMELADQFFSLSNEERAESSVYYQTLNRPLCFHLISLKNETRSKEESDTIKKLIDMLSINLYKTLKKLDG